jgi:O-antigen/teichoic acid export membrane protein
MNKLAHKATKSIITLTSKTVILNVINFMGALILAMFVSPAEFGTYILASTVVDILAYFSDIGLAGALIQKKGKLENKEVTATFTIQMGLVSIVIIIASLFAKVFINSYNLDRYGIYLYFALLGSFFLSSLKTIPSVISERKLQFKNVVIPQIVETLIYNITIVSLAYLGLGVRSYIWAVLARATSGTIIIYIMTKWKPVLNFDFKSVKKLLSFGIPYQLNGFIAVFKDRVSLLILGSIVGTEGMGYFGWAEKWANLPLRYFMDPAIKVTFPLFAKVQEDKKLAKQALEKSIYFISTLVFPALAGAFLVLPDIVDIIPKYEKWSPAINTFSLLLIPAAIGAVSTFLSNFLTAMGRMKQVMKLMIMWTILTLILYPLFANLFGYEGIAIASILVSGSSFVSYLLVKRMVANLNLGTKIVPSLVSSLAMIIGVILLNPYLGDGIFKLIVKIVSGVLIYTTIILLIDRDNLIKQSKVFINNLKSK